VSSVSVLRPAARRSRLLAAVLALAVSAAAGLVVAGVALPAVLSLGLTARAGADTFNDLPAELIAPSLPQASRMLDKDGRQIAYLTGPKDRVVVPLSAIPASAQNAVIAIEDNRFYDHDGIDFRGFARAAVRNSSAGEVREGGSTLTQQYVKNVLVESATTAEERAEATEQTVRRKLREARYALALERRIPKSKILENYLNIAYFGDGAYGIGTAATHYFGKPVSKLSLSEAALLAGIVRNPSAYEPVRQPAAARARRDVVLARMAELRMITTAQHAEAKKQPVKVSPRKRQADPCDGSAAAFYCDFVVRSLLADRRFGLTSDQRYRRLFEGGLTIRTALDPKVQFAAQASVDSVLPRDDPSQVGGAVAVVRPGTGDVLALAVNRRYGARKGTNDTKVSLATVPAFQSGSTFKVFTLVAAREQGLPLDLELDAPACYYSEVFKNPPQRGRENICEKGQGFRNAGDSEAGRFTMTQATWLSVNTYFIQLEERVGVPKVVDAARRMGVTSPTLSNVTPDEGSFTLGAREVSVLEMANAYATLAAHGKRCDPRLVTTVTVGKRPTDYGTAPVCRQTIEARIADDVTSMLRGVLLRGTARSAGVGRPAAGKTGTTNDSVAAWFVGYVPQMSAAVWVGNPKEPLKNPLRNIRINGQYHRQVYGGGLPATTWSRTMTAALTGEPVLPLPAPDYSVARGALETVPSLRGEYVGAALTQLRDLGFEGRVAGRVNSFRAYGTVAYTSPCGGCTAARGTSVQLYLSNGVSPPQVYVPPPQAYRPPVYVPPSRPAARPPVRVAPRPRPRPTATTTTVAPAPRPTPTPKPTATRPPPPTVKPTPKPTATAPPVKPTKT
jgi:membrane peptidoglycan carboxypeptidase